MIGLVVLIVILDNKKFCAIGAIPPASLDEIVLTLTEGLLEHDSKPLLRMGSSVFHVAHALSFGNPLWMVSGFPNQPSLLLPQAVLTSLLPLV